MITLAQRSQLTILYNEPHRHYHNLTHIRHCLRELDSIPVNPGVTPSIGITQDQRAILEAAIWFHDAVYDPRAPKGRNEGASIDLMHTANLSGVPLTTVEELIAATINHEIPQDEPTSSEDLMGAFLDIDLAILGQDESTYDEYAANIRAEFDWVPMSAYRDGRRQVLVTFLARKHIYFTPHFREKYEVQARANLAREALALVPDRPIHIHDPR